MLAASGLLVLGAAVYGWYVFNGGFSTDDWSHAAAAQSNSLWQLIPLYWGGLAYRPVDVIYLPLQHELFGAHPAVHLAWTLFVACAVSAVLYAVLREIGLERIHAFLIAALVLAFPFFDSTRLWATANLTQLAVLFCLAGLLLALRGLRARGRAAAAMHGGALLLYVAGIFTYEATAPVVALFGLLYLAGGRRRAAARWLADIATVAAAFAWVAANTPRQATSLSTQLAHAREIANQGASLLARSALPFGHVERLVPLALILGLMATAALVRRSLPHEDVVRPLLGQWVIAALGGLLLAGAGWLMFVPASGAYAPDASGLLNRTNAVAALGIVTTVSACAVLAPTLLLHRRAGGLRLAKIVTAALACLLLMGYVLDDRGDMRVWARAVQREDEVLTTLDRTVGKPPRAAVIYAFASPGFQAVGIPIFIGNWDLTGAVRVHWHDSTLAAYPMLGGAAISCGAHALRAVGWGPAPPAVYGNAFFVDLRAERAQRIGSVGQCRDALRRFH